MLKKLTGSRKAQVLAIIIIAALIITLVPIASNAGSSQATNVSERVSFSGVDVKLYSYNKQWKKEWHNYMIDGVKQTINVPNEDNGLLKGGRLVELKVYWNIEDMTDVKAGDFFEVDLPDQFFTYNYLGVEEPVYLESNKSVSVGTVKIIKDTSEGGNDYKFLVTLNQEAANSTDLKEGWLRADTTLNNSNDENVSLVYGDITSNLDLKAKDPANSQMWEKNNTKPISKMGWQETKTRNGVTKRDVVWRVEVGGENYVKTVKSAAEGAEGTVQSTEKKNIIVEDYLDDNLVFVGDKPATFSFWYTYMRNDGKVASTTFSCAGIDDQFEQVKFTDEEMANMTPQEFKDEIIKAGPLKYGIYQKKYFVLNAGSLSSDNAGVKLPYTLEKALSLLNSNYDKTNGPNGTKKIADQVALDASTAAWTNIYNNGNSAPSFYIQFRTEFIGHDATVINKVDTNWDGGVGTASADSTFKALSGGVDRGLPGSVTITKRDGETKEAMDGVSFKLQKYDSQADDYIDFTPRGGEIVKSTADGSVVFEGLTWGKYKVVEENALEGYTKEAVFKEFDEAHAAEGQTVDDAKTLEEGMFEITGGEIGTVNITALNFKEGTEEVIIDEIINNGSDSDDSQGNDSQGGSLGGGFLAFPIMNDANTIVIPTATTDGTTAGTTLGQLIEAGQVPAASIGDKEVPLYDGGLFSSWALLNLLFAIGGIAAAIFAAVKTFIIGRKEETEETEEGKKSKFQWLIASAVFAVGGLLLVILTQDLSATMVVVDKWTVFNAFLFAVATVSTVLTVKGEKSKEDTVTP